MEGKGLLPVQPAERPSCRNYGVLVFSVISPTPQGKSHFVVVLVLAGAACQVWQGRRCFKGVPAGTGMLVGVSLLGNTGASTWYSQGRCRMLKLVPTTTQLCRLGKGKKNGNSQYFCFRRNL